MSMKHIRRTLTAIQTDYVDAVIVAKQRWAHRKDGGHSQRSIGKARKAFFTEMRQWGYNDAFIAQALSDANDIVLLELNATEDE